MLPQREACKTQIAGLGYHTSDIQEGEWDDAEDDAKFEGYWITHNECRDGNNDLVAGHHGVISNCVKTK